MALCTEQVVVGLILTLLISKSTQQADVLSDGNVTCSTMFTSLGQTAHVTCHYPVDVRNSSFRPLSLDVELYRNKSINAEHVLTCQWMSGTTDTPCSTTDGYAVSGTVDRQLTLNITALSPAHLGSYVCKIMTPGVPSDTPVPCIMALPETVMTDKKIHMYAIIGGVVGGVLLVVVVVVVVVVLVRTKRQICVCCLESKYSPQPGDQSHNTNKRSPRLCCAKSSDSAGETIVSLSTEVPANDSAKKEKPSRRPETSPLISVEELEYQRSESYRLDQENQERVKRLQEGLKKMEEERLKREAELKAKEEEKRKEEERLKQVIEQNRQVREGGYKNLPPLSIAAVTTPTPTTTTFTAIKPTATVPPLPPKAPLAGVSEYDVPPIHKKDKSDETYDIGEYPWEDFPIFIDKPAKKIPKWAKAENLEKAVEKQDENPPNLDAIFSVILPPNLNELFDQKRSRFNIRTSSANWHGPPHKHF